MLNIDNEIDSKIDEFFFGPGQKTEEFNRLFTKNNPGDPIRRSPLYIARRDIYFCFGMNPEDPKHVKKLFTDGIGFGPAFFAGIWLIWETLITLARCQGINSRDNAQQNDFIAKLFKISISSTIALRKLRNAVTHINYGLRYRDERDVLWQFNLNSKSGFLIRKMRRSNYPSNNYVVNPIIFHQKFEKGLTELKKRLLDKKNIQLRDSFNNSEPTKRSNWVAFS
jgi:hypothetical protein